MLSRSLASVIWVEILTKGIVLKYVTAAFIFFGILLSQVALGKKASLIDLELDADQSSTIVTLKFDKRIPDNKLAIEDHGTFLNLPLQNVIIPEPGKFFEGNGPYVSKSAVFQFSPDKSAVRIFVTEDASLLKKATSLDHLNDRLLLVIDHKKLEELGLTAHRPKKKEKTAEAIVAKTKVDKSIPDPYQQTSGITLMNDEELTHSLTLATIFSAVMLSLLIAGMFIRNRMKSSRFMGKVGESIQMKTLETFTIAPKKNLTLVQVGEQRLLLGISPENISFLTSIDDRKGSDGAMVSQMFNGAPNKFESALNEPDHRQAQRQAALRKSAVRKKVAKDKVQKKIPQAKKETPAKVPAAYQKAITVNDKPSAETLEDVTSLIRRKLQNLPKI